MGWMERRIDAAVMMVTGTWGVGETEAVKGTEDVMGSSDDGGW